MRETERALESNRIISRENMDIRRRLNNTRSIIMAEDPIAIY